MGRMFGMVGRRAHSILRPLACLGTLALLAPSSLAQVQTVVPPIFSSVDDLGVDVSTGQYRLSTSEVVIGQPGAGGLAFGRHWIGSGWRDSLAGTISSAGGIYTVSLGASSESFSVSGGIYTSLQAMGSTLTYSSGTNKHTYTTRDGTVIVFNKNIATQGSVTNFWSSNEGAIETITRPSGEVVTFTYVTATSGGVTAWRPQSITNTLGYQIHFTYAIGSPNNASEVTGGFLQRTKVTGYNRAFFFCADNAHSCADSTGANWPYVTYGTEAGGVQTVADRLSRVMRYVITSGQLTAIRLPTSSTLDRVAIQYSAGHVTSVSSSVVGSDGASYSYSDNNGIRTTTINPTVEGGDQVVLTNLANGWTVEQWDDPLGTRKAVLARDSYGRVTRTTWADGRYADQTYDARGNVTQTVLAPKSGSNLSNVVTSAAYSPTCANPKTCNQPISTTDMRGFRTDYDYSPTHGGVTSITSSAPSGPAPIGSGTRPQLRFSYSSLSAWYKNSSGSLVAGPALHRLAATSACATGAWPGCLNTLDETRSVVTYQTGSSSVPSNLLVASATGQAGTGALASTIAMTYTAQGDLATVDGPLSGSSDTTRWYYDDIRRLRATVGPDPDGAGTLIHRVVKLDYDSDNLVLTYQLGSVASPSNWATLTVLQQQEIAYTSGGLPGTIKQASLTADPPHVVAQFDYLGGDNVSCSAVRMNPATFAALPASACTAATEGAFGPDRRTRPARNDLFEATNFQDAYGTPEQRNSATMTYTSMGELATIKDAENKLTTYEYDGLGRLTKTRYPHISSANVSSTTDFEELTYGNTSNRGLLLAWRGRDNQSFNYAYDNLGRLTSVDAPGTQPDVTYVYDNLGRVTQISQPGHALSYTYDALGRIVSESQAGRTVSYAYDAAGRRTRLDWPDGFYVTYDYNAASDLVAIRENGQNALASFTYDNLGRRIAATRSNGGATGYTYDTSSRLTDLLIDPTGGAFDSMIDLGYNPANQIVSRASTNAAYAFSQPSFQDIYADNGLNQYSSAGGVTPTYTDLRGNLTFDGARTYGFDHSNRLVSASGSPAASLSYDPGDRLYQVTGSSTVRFLYDGADVIAEYNSAGNVLRRYVHGPGMDEPLVWFEGAGHSASGTPDRRHLYADERGSIVVVEGSTSTLNKYDVYGVPAVGNIGRFQYTGQMWIGEVGLYHYKARAYNPELGRFMQTDPIGYGDGMNLYAYVGNDPVNWKDPFGLFGWQDDDPDEVEVVGPRQKGEPRGTLRGGLRRLGAFDGMTPPSGFGGIGSDGFATAWWENSEDGQDRFIVSCNAACRWEYAWRNAVRQAGAAVIRNAFFDYEACRDLAGCASELLLSTYGRVGKIIGKACGCFVAGTMVMTADGLRPIEEIAVGDLVLSWDERSNRVEMRAVTELIRPEPKPIWQLEARDADGNSEYFHTTGDHPWFAQGRGWLETIDLRPGQTLLTADGRGLTVVAIIATDRREKTYNLTVDGFNTFLVGSSATVVHNACKQKLEDIAQELFDQGIVGGPFTVFRRDAATGKVNAYQTFTPNPRNPRGLQKGDRYRGDGGTHGGVTPPLIINPKNNRARPANPEEIPR